VTKGVGPGVTGVTTGTTGVGGEGAHTTTAVTTTVGNGGAGPTTTVTATSVTSTGVATTSGVTTSVTTTGAGGSGGGGPLCPHGVCIEGPPLDPGCGMCEASVCAQDFFCCQVFWDGLCVQEANQLCMANCPICPHDVCSTGGPLSLGCDPCVPQVCAVDPTCCSVGWDGSCIQLVGSVCMQFCP
jgi:hypothetical protein